ncbi:MAG: helix-turn-helix domain-containing protein [Bacteroidota bacterium]|nr:helix-turn-helix domain-containing protein [Bacteroidota bacterium]
MEYIDLLILFKNTRKESVSLNEYGKDEVLFNLLRILLITSERIKRTRINNSIKDIGDLTLLEDFKKHLEIHYSNSRSVQYYSDILNITPKKLNRVTFSYWGKSSKQVIEERVLLETKRLLIHTNQSVKEIGMLLGFNDPTNFNKFFKKSTNMTPVYFRLSYKKLI